MCICTLNLQKKLMYERQNVQFAFTANSRGRATHSKALGWKPKYTTQDLIASIKPEIEAILQQQAKQH